ncbi:dihydrodipicolinate synthase family protein [Acerihabitans sp. KWT182]|uniref:Dihydrodipicolinate synthase family protein n=1 Tax=Acerihabitans sp. KWT182 TaxID=3157919 RepID=A0AAU7QBH5_9GAMM
MTESTGLHGVIPPVPTIVDADGRLDAAGMGRLIDHLIASGVDGLLILGSGGEFCHMTPEQRHKVAEFSVGHIAGRVPVLLGISSTSTEEVIRYGRQADALGVDTVLVLNPYYARLTDEAIYRHYARVVENIATPVMLYNFPDLTGQSLSIPLISRLATTLPQIIGIKDTVDNASHVREIIRQVRPLRPDFAVFSGYDEYMLDNLILGGNGGIPATANFAPHIACGLYRAWRDKEYETLFRLQRKISRLSAVYQLETPFFGIVKEAIRQSGVDISTYAMPPVSQPSAENVARLSAILQSVAD